MRISDTVITSRKNDRINFVCSLSEKKYRDKYGVFVLEGLKLLDEGVRRGALIKTLFLSETAQKGEISGFISRYEKQLSDDTEVFFVSRECFEKMSSEHAPDGILAVVEKKKPADKCPAKFVDFDGGALLLYALQDPGNLGTILRSAAAFGLTHFFLTSDCADIYNLKTIRASMGAIFSLEITMISDAETFVTQLRGSGRRVFAAELREHALPLHAFALKPTDCFIIGNEGHGIPPHLSALCDSSVYIPVTNKVESLNAATAASIIMWEMSKLNQGR